MVVRAHWPSQPTNRQTYTSMATIDWLTVKDNWDLTVTLPELDALTGMLDTCATPPDLQLSQGGNPIVPRPTNGPHYPTPTPTAITYSSCDAAQAPGNPVCKATKAPHGAFPSGWFQCQGRRRRRRWSRM